MKDKILNTNKEILKRIIQVDGHTIYNPKKFAELEPEIVKAFTHNHHSGNTEKETIYVDNQEVPELTGVYGLELLEFIAECFDVTSWKMGRGSRAEHLKEQLLEKWK